MTTGKIQTTKSGKIRITPSGKIATSSSCCCQDECPDCVTGLPTSFSLTGKVDGHPFECLTLEPCTGADFDCLACLQGPNGTDPVTNLPVVNAEGIDIHRSSPDPCGWLLEVGSAADIFLAGSDPRGSYPDTTAGGHVYTELVVG